MNKNYKTGLLCAGLMLAAAASHAQKALIVHKKDGSTESINLAKMQYASFNYNYLLLRNTGSTSFISIPLDNVRKITFGAARKEEIGVGISAVEHSAIRIFPNPTSGIITIEEGRDVSSVELYDNVGRCVGTYAANSIDMSSLPNGIYYVHIGNIVKKIIKQ
ncbi:MAG: T9SS type A sorting domain-containing protein [Bacteroidales bacterium]|jgi:hypothetical protein|nr:T9SS type A sorting domain-containing protein [Bacteroidales bacterium]